MNAFENGVVKNCRYQETCVEPDASRFLLNVVERAVVFAHADWSGSSYACLKGLCHALESKGSGIPLIILNSDTLPESLARDLFERNPEGWGETAWVLNGRVVGRTPYKSAPATFVDQMISDLT